MRTPVVFVTGFLLGSVIATGLAQGNRLAGENYVNHVGMAVENFDEAFNFYTQKMGFREAFTVKDAAGKPTLPTTIGQEIVSNPFLRADRPRLLKAIGMEKRDPVEVFAEKPSAAVPEKKEGILSGGGVDSSFNNFKIDMNA